MSSYNIDIQYPGIQGAVGTATAGGFNTDIQYNGSGTLVGTGNFTTDGLGNVSISGQTYGDGLLTITTAGSDAGQQPALILRDESNGVDGVSQYFQWGNSGTYNYQVSINYNGSIFSFNDDYNSLNILNYQYPTSLSVGNASTGLFLTGLNTTLVESTGSVTLTLGNPDQQTTQNPNLYVNGQNAAIWAQGQNARLYANDGTGTNFIAAGTDGVVVGLAAYTDAKGRGTVNAESYYVNGVPFAAAAVAVASLPGLLAGSRAFVNDSSVGAAGNFGAIVAGGAANFVPVWCDGANWRIG